MNICQVGLILAGHRILFVEHPQYRICMCMAPLFIILPWLAGYAGTYIGTVCICVHLLSSHDELCPWFMNVAKNVARKWKSVHFCHQWYFVYNIVPMICFASIFGDNIFPRDSTWWNKNASILVHNIWNVTVVGHNFKIVYKPHVGMIQKLWPRVTLAMAGYTRN